MITSGGALGNRLLSVLEGGRSLGEAEHTLALVRGSVLRCKDPTGLIDV